MPLASMVAACKADAPATDIDYLKVRLERQALVEATERYKDLWQFEPFRKSNDVRYEPEYLRHLGLLERLKKDASDPSQAAPHVIKLKSLDYLAQIDLDMLRAFAAKPHVRVIHFAGLQPSLKFFDEPPPEVEGVACPPAERGTTCDFNDAGKGQCLAIADVSKFDTKFDSTGGSFSSSSSSRLAWRLGSTKEDVIWRASAQCGGQNTCEVHYICPGRLDYDAAQSVSRSGAGKRP